QDVAARRGRDVRGAIAIEVVNQQRGRVEAVGEFSRRLKAAVPVAEHHEDIRIPPAYRVEGVVRPDQVCAAVLFEVADCDGGDRSPDCNGRRRPEYSGTVAQEHGDRLIQRRSQVDDDQVGLAVAVEIAGGD